MRNIKFLFYITLLFLGCGDSNTQSKNLSQIATDIKIEIVDGDQQSQLPNKPFNRNLKIRLFQPSTQTPLSGIPFHFELVSGDATLNLKSQPVTDSLGMTQITAASGRSLGEVKIQAFPEGLSTQDTQKVMVTFTLLIVNVRESRLIPIDSSSLKQTVVVNNLFPKPLGVKAVDADGLPLKGEQIAFTPQPSSQVYVNITSVDSFTSEGGKASATVQMGSYAGPFAIDASLVNHPGQTVTFQLTGIADAPFNIFPVSGHVENGYKVCVGENESLANPIRFLVVDAFNNPVPNQPVKITSSAFLNPRLNHQPAGQALVLNTNVSGEIDVDVQVGTIPVFAIPGQLPPYSAGTTLYAQVVNAPSTVETRVDIDVTKQTYLHLVSDQNNYVGTIVSPGNESFSYYASIYAYGKCFHLLPTINHSVSTISGCSSSVTHWPTETPFLPIQHTTDRIPFFQPLNFYLFGFVMSNGTIESERDRFFINTGESVSVFTSENSCPH